MQHIRQVNTAANTNSSRPIAIPSSSHGVRRKDGTDQDTKSSVFTAAASSAPQLRFHPVAYYKKPVLNGSLSHSSVTPIGSLDSTKSDNDVTQDDAWTPMSPTEASVSLSLSLEPMQCSNGNMEEDYAHHGDEYEEDDDAELRDVKESYISENTTPTAPCPTPVQLNQNLQHLYVDAEVDDADQNDSLMEELERATSPKNQKQDTSFVDAAILSMSRMVSMSPEMKGASPLPPALRYTVKRKIMKTLFGTLDLCTDEVTGEEVVVKRSLFSEITKLRTRQHPCKENAFMECELMRTLPPHPYVLPLLDEQEDFTFHYTVMPYCAKGDALDYTLAQPGHHLSEWECKKLFKQALLGLQHIHQHGVTHLDISLENLLITDKGDIRIADFGLARRFPKGTTVFPAEPGTRPGKRYYMSPEIYQRGAFCGRQSDMWSMGVVLFVMCFGSYPFKEPNLDVDARFAKCYKEGTSQMLRAIGKADHCPRGAQQIMDMLMCPVQKRATLEQVLSHPWLQ